MSVNLKSLSDSDIFDAGRYEVDPAFRRRVYGRQKLPPMPFAKYVNVQGHVVALVLTHGPAQRNTETPHAYARRDRMERFGGVRYGECPFYTAAGKRWMPKEMKAKADPCDIDLFDGGRHATYGEHKACPHIEELIAIRQKKHKKAEIIRAERMKTLAQRKLELEEKRNEAILAQLANLAEQGGQSGDSATGTLFKKIAGNKEFMQLLNQMALSSQDDPDPPVPEEDPVPGEEPSEEPSDDSTDAPAEEEPAPLEEAPEEPASDPDTATFGVDGDEE